MKKLMSILAIILLASCGTDTKDMSIVISISEYSIKGEAVYKTNNSDNFRYGSFIAPIGLYNIGDTIHFVKR